MTLYACFFLTLTSTTLNVFMCTRFIVWYMKPLHAVDTRAFAIGVGQQITCPICLDARMCAHLPCALWNCWVSPDLEAVRGLSQHQSHGHSSTSWECCRQLIGNSASLFIINGHRFFHWIFSCTHYKTTRIFLNSYWRLLRSWLVKLSSSPERRFWLSLLFKIMHVWWNKISPFPVS